MLSYISKKFLINQDDIKITNQNNLHWVYPNNFLLKEN